jgi:hypothetical protein
MKKLIALVMALAVFVPTLAFAGASTDAALGLGAFAVFNQMLGGVGIFHRGGVVAPAPVVVAPAPVFVPAPVVVAAPRFVERPYPVYVPAPRHVVARGPVFCAPGPRHGWCDPAPVHPGWRY